MRAQAGVPGLRLEEWLNERGYTFPTIRRPTSRRSAATWPRRAPGCSRRSTGRSRTWSARSRSRSSGELMRTVPIPRHAVGPDLNQLFIGSEGTLGVITEATLLIRPLPEHRSFRLVAFEDLATGIEAMRRVLQAGWRPAAVRLHDPEATRVNLARVLDADVSGVKLVLVFDGPRPLVETEEREVLRSLVADGGRDEGTGARRAVVGEPLSHLLPPVPAGAAEHLGDDRSRGRVRADPSRVRGRPRADAGCLRPVRPRLHRPLLPLVSVGDDGLRALRARGPADDVDTAIAIYDEIWRRTSR